MAAPRKADVHNLEKVLREESPFIAGYIIAGLLIWLFAVLVFLPLAYSVSQKTGTLISIIMYIVLLGVLVKSVFVVKRITDAVAIFPARRFYQKRKTEPEATYFLFQHAFYMSVALVIYLLSLPFLLGFHASIAGLILISLLIWLIYVIIKTFPVISGVILGRIIEG